MKIYRILFVKCKFDQVPSYGICQYEANSFGDAENLFGQYSISGSYSAYGLVPDSEIHSIEILI